MGNIPLLHLEVAKMTNAFAPEKIYTRELVAKGNDIAVLC
jgi:hypothetical protein